ncbi:hypothetical protein V2G26_015637 [Clonostachys chloroleuca]
MANQGQICTSASHFMAQRSVYDKIVADLVERAKATLGLVILLPTIGFGPTGVKTQYERGLLYRKKRYQEGATVGLERKPCQLSKGKTYVVMSAF